MDHHNKTLGIIQIIYGSLLFSQSILALIAMQVFKSFFYRLEGAALYGNDLPYLASNLIFDIIWVTAIIIPMILALPALISGFGLYNNKGWARGLALIIGILALFNFPIGTAMGIYTIWVYFRPARVEVSVSTPT